MTCDWIVVDAADQKIKCLRCGAWWPLNLPASVSDLCARLKAFDYEHVRCDPKPERVSSDTEPPA